MRLATLAILSLLLGQPFAPYGGDWTADFQGTTYIRIALKDDAGSPQGAMSICSSIQTDGQGNVKSVTVAASTLIPMLDVHRSGEVLSFSYKKDNDVDKFELRVIDANTAELTMLLPEE